ncbi:MAG: folylpolyglutamate synthase/dihydrofolate synthase family protein [Cyclobacteriaceae bacterium]|nr:folylpolyglutamate synthase/dihydrofolate synthase family protein [Cyclobacteriaceae bacterium]
MNFQDTLQYMYALLPMYQRIGNAAFKKDLTNTLKLCEFIGNPQKHVKMIHVAGTNGKGSSAHMIASILQAAGYTTGLYTSPHLKNFTERIRIDGEEIEEQFVCEFIEKIQKPIVEIQPSFFEVTVAMAFDYFLAKEVDIAVIEVGLGGRFDSTNIIHPLISLITSIGYDHTDLLGNTLPEIAFEKAGIIKQKVPVVISQTQEEIRDVFMNKSLEMTAPIFFADEEISLHFLGVNDNMADYQAYYHGNTLIFSTDLLGNYQIKNIPGVLRVIQLLNYLGFMITDPDIVRGFSCVIPSTGLRGRWQKIGENPLVICDTVHNVSGIDDVVDQLNALDFDQLFIIWGVVEGKKPELMLSRLPVDARYFFCEPALPRAMKAQKLSEIAGGFGLQGEIIPDVNDALAKARSIATKTDLIFIGGSNFIVAELKEL